MTAQRVAWYNPPMSNFPAQHAKLGAGVIESIHIAADARAPAQSVGACTSVPGKGNEGDRYARQAGTFSDWPKDHELTLVEAEALQGMAETGFSLEPGESRRNLTTRGISLNELVGKEFLVGEVRCRGTRLCHPCEHLETLLNRPGLVKAMANRGGLRALILTAGAIRVGDRLEELTEAVSPGSPAIEA